MVFQRHSCNRRTAAIDDRSHSDADFDIPSGCGCRESCAFNGSWSERDRKHYWVHNAATNWKALNRFVMFSV